jgi:hypothetical protein
MLLITDQTYTHIPVHTAMAMTVKVPVKYPPTSSPWTRDDFDFGNTPKTIRQGRFRHVYEAKKGRSGKKVATKVLFLAVISNLPSIGARLYCLLRRLQETLVHFV